MSIGTGKTGSVYVKNGDSAFTDEATTCLGDTSGDSYIYIVDNSAIRTWDPAVAVTVSSGVLDLNYYDNGVNYFEGKVRLNVAGDTTIEVSGTFISLKKAAYVYGWSLSGTVNVAETTCLGDSWKTNTSLDKSATISLNRYRGDSEFTKLTTTDPVFLKLYEDTDSGFYAVGNKTSFSYTKAIGAVGQEPVSFEVNGQVKYF